jgi:copper chaperone NosL
MALQKGWSVRSLRPRPFLLAALMQASVVVFLVLLSVACSRHQVRCANCGMLIDPKSAWNAELVLPDHSKVEFDSPRCALMALRSGRYVGAEVRVEEYYDRSWRNGEDVLFVLSSDVLGPMGPDAVAVDPARARTFVRDHTGTRPLHLAEVTATLLKELH